MKKLIIGAIVGGILIFVWQTLSFVLLNLHAKAFQYTPKQTEIMNFLNTQITEDGQYYMPGLPETATREEHQQLMTSLEGKPWATIAYHKAWEMSMGMNMVRGLFVNILAAGLLCWILLKMNLPSFTTILLSSIFTGLIVFLTAPYTAHIWYQSFDLMAHFIDSIMAWGLCGLWLGWWLTRGRTR